MKKFSVFALILGLTMFSAGQALAHSELVANSPLKDSTVEAGPIQVKLDFDEAPMNLPFGQGNLIAVANAVTGEQLGPACAKIEGTSLTTVVNLSEPGKYRILWRIASDDGHINNGDFEFTVVNNSNYSTDKPGNQCFDANGKELDITNQEPLSVKVQQNDGLMEGFFWGLGFILVGTLAGALLVKNRQK